MEQVFGNGLRRVVKEVVGLVTEGRADGVDHMFFSGGCRWRRGALGFFDGRGFLKIMPKSIWFDYGVCPCDDNLVLIYAISRFRYYFYWSLRMCMVGKSR